MVNSGVLFEGRSRGGANRERPSKEATLLVHPRVHGLKLALPPLPAGAPRLPPPSAADVPPVSVPPRLTLSRLLPLLPPPSLPLMPTPWLETRHG